MSGATRSLVAASAAAALLLAAPSMSRVVQPLPIPPTPAIVGALSSTSGPFGDQTARTTLVPGTAPQPVVPQSVIVEPKRGTISLNFPSAAVSIVAKAVLGDLLGINYAIAQGVSAPVTLVTPGPVARSALFGLFEASLRAANLALVRVAGGYEIQSTEASKGPVDAGVAGYGSELVELKFINADEVRKLLDTVLPGVVTATDPTRNAVTIVGTTGQRESARGLLKQFDVDWLRNTSFALYVPQRTDARLIAPELDKLINAPDAPTRGLVRLIAMERLNGILAISAQPRYLDDVRRWVEVLDREGEGTEPRIYVYRVQNGRSKDLARTINAAFGIGGDQGSGADNPDPFAAAQPAGTTRVPGVPNLVATPPAGQSGQGGTSLSPGAGGSGTTSASADQAGRGIGARITSDETNNAVIVYATPRDYAVVEDALRRLDVPPYQVMIEAAISEVTLNDSLRYGVQWNFDSGRSNVGYSEGATVSPVRVLPGFSYFYSGNDISATLNALEQRTNVKVISAPKLMVLNNQTAAIQIGNEVPISTGSVSSVVSGGANALSNSIDYKDTGVILKVTPRVNAGGLVLLDISQEVSDVIAATGTQTQSQSPTISTRRIATSVAVQDQQVIALGGLFRDSRTYGKNGVPIISRIPVLGALFGTHDDEQVRTELIVLLKPHVLRTADDGRAVTEELRSKLRTLEPFRSSGRIP